jgi:hypothetical protein
MFFLDQGIKFMILSDVSVQPAISASIAARGAIGGSAQVR